MDINNHAGDAPNSEENFAEMFEQSFKKLGKLGPGQMVETVIVKISPEWIFLDLGGKGEGYLDRKELTDEAGNISVREGDTIRAYFVSSNNNEMHFTTKIGSGPGKQSQIEDAWRNHVPVEGTFAKEIKGGFEIKIGGSVRAFCPFSQSGIRRGENQADYIGRSFPFMIMEYSEDGRNIVLSRRPILEEEKRSRTEALRAELKEGMKVKGKVTSIQTFGAFIDIGGIEGLLPISEISYSRTEKVSDILSNGQDVEVILKKLDWENNRFSFSLKDTLPDPWDQVVEAYPAGSYHSGKVARLAPFGAFVTLKEGVDGLVHISKLGAGRKINHPREVLKEGQEVEVKIEAVDRAARKLSLSLAEISRAAEEEAETIREFRQKESSAPQAMGSLGEMLKAKMDQKKN
ncbi:MAG TPA: 30S ribosomal protein S1 [Nitrospirota bacterium]|nr:30S ribosomal protein S1 [Nitrospirota bacterium]